MSAAVAQRWQRLSMRIEALGQRERMLCFAATAALLLVVVQAALLGPLARQQDLLRVQSTAQASKLAETNNEIARLVAASSHDPNELLRDKLNAVRADTLRMSDELRTMQRGLVPPERIAPLLESMLRANGRLQLVSLRTLPVDTIDGTAADADPNKAPPAADAGVSQQKPVALPGTVLYRHGVELTVRGSYLDMVDAMGALEALPTQLFWGRAQLDVEDYPKARLTLTLYTLSLDPKWMKL
jgi:MSHA biogenesis protein MshJ